MAILETIAERRYTQLQQKGGPKSKTIVSRRNCYAIKSLPIPNRELTIQQKENA
jgi:hypothetical protein